MNCFNFLDVLIFKNGFGHTNDSCACHLRVPKVYVLRARREEARSEQEDGHVCAQVELAERPFPKSHVRRRDCISGKVSPCTKPHAKRPRPDSLKSICGSQNTATLHLHVSHMCAFRMYAIYIATKSKSFLSAFL